jgi:serine O-acetyltransferase
MSNSFFATVKSDFLRAQRDRRPRLWWVVLEMVRSPGFRAMVYHRLAHALLLRGVPILPSLLRAHSIRSTGADISPGCRIGLGLLLPHPVGIVLGGGVVVGENCCIYQNVTCGELLRPDRDHSYPVIGDRVVLSAGAVCLGGITVGSDSIVGANSVVTRAVSSGTVVAGAPAKVIRTWQSERTEPASAVLQLDLDPKPSALPRLV